MSMPSDRYDAADTTADPVVELYKRDVDRTLLRERLKLTVDQRLRDLEQLQRDVRELRRAGCAVK